MGSLDFALISDTNACCMCSMIAFAVIVVWLIWFAPLNSRRIAFGCWFVFGCGSGYARRGRCRIRLVVGLFRGCSVGIDW